MSKSQADKVAQAQYREQAARKARERSERFRKLLLIVVAVILAVGLSLPTMALLVMRG